MYGYKYQSGSFVRAQDIPRFNKAPDYDVLVDLKTFVEGDSRISKKKAATPISSYMV